MTDDTLTDEYLEWIIKRIDTEKNKNVSVYSKLLDFLYSRDFLYKCWSDENRAKYGEDLRYGFGLERGYSYRDIDDHWIDKPCSVLEMMVALAIKCEGIVEYDPDDGNHTGYWFWKMIENLGLISMKNSKFDKKKADWIIDRFLNKEYEKDGKGGLFIVHSDKDMRIADIWYQMLWYLDEYMAS